MIRTYCTLFMLLGISLHGSAGPGRPGNKPSVHTGRTKQALVRNFSAAVRVTQNRIQQGDVVIGYLQSNTRIENGHIITSKSVLNPQGMLLASARNHGVTDHNWEVFMYRDRTSHSISSSLGHDDEDLTSYLVRLGYL
ncbi:MAG: hypothetical protein JNL57_01885 [Bacteroidetes bacterium]|nr:hypothetical protein [Bacteroidota bacterium]